MKKIIIILVLISIAGRGMSQEVINSKGTKVFIDSSKWAVSGNNIYYKNSGNVGIGSSSPTAQLHTTLDVRFAGIGTNTTNTKVLTTDAYGNVTTRLFSNLLSGNALTSLNGLTNSVQTFAIGTSGSSFNIVSSGQAHTFNLPAASATSSGTLSSADWAIFNNKISIVTATTPAAVTSATNTATINNTGAYWNANKLQGNAIAATTPANGQVLSWNGTSWTPAVAAPATTTHTISSAANIITSVVNGVSVTAPAVNNVSNTSSANALTTTINGITGSSVNMVNSNTLTQNESNQLVSTVNGVASKALTAAITGDVTGNMGETTVSKINGSPLGKTTGATSGQVLSWNGAEWVPATTEQTTGAARLTSNFSTSSTSATSTNLSFAIDANEIYYVTIEGTASKSSSSSGMKLAIAAPSGCTISGEAYLGGSSLSTAPTPSLITSINTLGSTFATGNGVRVTFRMTFQVTNSSVAGNITLQAATVSSNTAIIYAGTRMSWIKANAL
ncbi:MAG: hypothetical protein HOP10_04290 [Chitinophagaceae bacterium]|nr:hypothetical protein [Chitinophagaceae bacterium]